MPRRIALFGQAAFAKDVLVRLLEAGHEIVGVYAPPVTGRPDPLAEEAEKRGLRTFRYKAFRRQGVAIAERVAEYRALGAELNVMPYTTVILPPEIVDAPPLGSLCFHPSLLPRFRGGAAIPWQIILGECDTGVTVFVPDAGVDTGPIVVQKRGVAIDATDTAASLYFDKLYPLGLEAIAEAVAAVDAGRARTAPQDDAQATFQGLVTDDVAHIAWNRSATEIDRLIRGCDPNPGAWSERASGERVRCFDARFIAGEADAEPGSALGIEDGRLVVAAVGGRVAIGKLRVGDGAKAAAPAIFAAGGVEAGERLR
jgi:methionyl-tRNA formyltransferase